MNRVRWYSAHPDFFVKIYNSKMAKLAISTIAQLVALWYDMHIRVKCAYSTKIDADSLNKRRKYPFDSRYGSVETCRKAAGILLSGM